MLVKGQKNEETDYIDFNFLKPRKSTSIVLDKHIANAPQTNLPTNVISQ